MACEAPFFRFQKVGGSVNDCLDQLKKTTPGVRQKVLKQLPAEAGEWVVQEKVHGSNFSIYVRRNIDIDAEGPKSADFRIDFAKRNGFLDFEQDCFYNFQSIAAELRRNSIQVFKAVERMLWERSSSAAGDGPAADVKKGADPAQDPLHKNTDLLVVIYGELFGGWYPGSRDAWIAEVQSRIVAGKVKIPFAQRAVQEGIYYSPELEFMVFDVGICRSPGGDGAELEFLDFPDLQLVVSRKSSFLFAEPLATFDDYEKAAFDFSLDFDSTIPARINERRARASAGRGASLPMPPAGENTAEGIIIRPSRNISLQKLAANVGSSSSAAKQAPKKNIKDAAESDAQQEHSLSVVRPLVKRKHAKFAEVVDNLDMDMGGDAQKSYAFVFAARLVNNNRLNAVLSKMGDVPLVRVDASGTGAEMAPTDEAKSEIVSLLAADSWEDWYLHFNYHIEDYDEAEAYVQDICRRLVEAERW